MRNRFLASIMAVAAVCAIGVFSLTVRPIAGQTQAYKAPRTTDGKPDLNGFWQALNTANWDIQAHAAAPGAFPYLLGAIGAVPGGQGVVAGNEIPYQPWAAAKKKENFEKRLKPESFRDPYDRSAGDPEARCFLPGVPRVTYMPFPFQIIQGPNKIAMAYEYAETTRTIHLDKVGRNPAPTWMGHSVGRWEGDTLVVDVSDFVGETWFDRAGNFHSDALHVIERYTPITPYHLMYEATIEDPKVFTRPWTISMPLYRRMEKDVQLLEFRCVEFVEELMYGPLLKR